MTTGTASLTDAGAAIAAPVRPGDLVADKYRVEQTIGVGGMGVVVAATDEGLERRVAIKFLLPKFVGSETAAQRFVREARAATRITSEHVVRLLEIDKLESGTPFFVMEYLQGRDLRTLLREDGPLRHSTAVDYVLQALQAVAEGHLKGIVHRDLKPGNLFLTARADGTPLIKVLDFGIAKQLDQQDVVKSQLTSSDDVRLGSPAYMPPEQLHSARDVDARSDIWSMGATLYELLSGKPPFEGQSYAELVSRILTGAPKPISSRTPTRVLPRGLQEVILRCLEKDREARFANAAELANALAQYGSEDARVSLTRVVGMNALPAPGHASASRLISDSGSSTCTTTLAVVGDEVSTRKDPRTAPPPAKAVTKRSWVVVGGVAAIVAAVFALRGGSEPLPAKVEPPRAVVPSYPEPATPPPVVEAQEPAPPTPTPATKPSGTPPNTKVTSSPPRPVVVVPAAVESKAAEKPAVFAPEPSAEPAAPVAPGRSETIERLIESRR